MCMRETEKRAQSSRSDGSALSNRVRARVFNSDRLGWGVGGRWPSTLPPAKDKRACLRLQRDADTALGRNECVPTAGVWFFAFPPLLTLPRTRKASSARKTHPGSGLHPQGVESVLSEGTKDPQRQGCLSFFQKWGGMGQTFGRLCRSYGKWPVGTTAQLPAHHLLPKVPD